MAECDNSVSELCKVSTFLRSRGVEDQIVERFLEENMDAVAVSHASDNTLRGLGLKTGDILSLKAFITDSQANKSNSVQRGEREKRKLKLIEQLQADKGKKAPNGTKRKAESSQAQGGKQRLKVSKKVQIGWMHYNEQQQRYVPVRMAKGGGSRDIDMPVDSNIEAVLESATSIYFPDGSSLFGELDDMVTNVGNYKGDVISTLKDENGEVHEFSVKKYYEVNKTNRARLYLMSRVKQHPLTPAPLLSTKDEQKVEDKKKLPGDSPIVVEDDECSESESELFYPTLLDSDWLENIEPSIGSLIGSSSERTYLIAEQDDAFLLSQASDLAKMEEKNEEANRKAHETQRINQLRSERASRVPEEPSSKQNAVTVNIRHIDMGLLSRSFPSSGTVSFIYDWIGSLNALPEHFRLCKVPGEEISPSEPIASVHKCTLFMEVAEDPILLSPSGEISFQGFGSVADQVIRQNHREQTHPESVTTTTSETAESQESPYTTLCIKQDRSRNLLLPPSYEGHQIERDNIVNHLLKLYTDGVVDTKEIAFFRFAGENAGGDGVTCDVFSCFWDEFFSKYCEGCGQCVPLLTVQFSDDDYEAIGKIITHMFLSFQIFPVRLSEALIQYCLFGVVSDECLLSSFLNLLSTNDRHILQTSLQNPSVNLRREEILDILADYNITTLPTKENLMSLLLNAARLTLVSKPLFFITNLKKGMGRFWDTVTADEIRSIYELTVPTAERVVNVLTFNESCEADRKVGRWLERFVRDANEVMLRRLVQFSTSLPMLMPHRSIGVVFEDQPPNHLRPVGATCFKMLKLPRQYVSFSQLKENLEFYLTNTHLWNMSE